MFLKFVTMIIAILFVIDTHAANYYFSSSGNDSYTTTQAQNKTTPWKTLNKLNTYFPSLSPGDSILFKCGDTFTGTITITKSGTAAKPIILSSYGTGSKPIISGFVPATTWVNLGGGIYQANCPSVAATVNIVTLNSASQPMGRFPNANAANGGYLNIDSHVGTTSITSSQLNTAVNWTGAEIVMRKNHWVVDRASITSNTATVVNYSGVSIYQPTNNFGFFIQNNPNTLDQFGEWYFDPVAKKINVYWGATTPSDTSVLVGSANYLISSNTYNYITIKGITFKGANLYALFINFATGFQILNSDFISNGVDGVYGYSTTNLTVSNCNFKDINSCSIYNQVAYNSQILNNTVTNTGIYPGMGQSGNSTYEGIIVKGTHDLISGNSVSNTGYCGIEFEGDTITVKNNFVTNFTSVKDDGGGIYTWGGNLDSLTNNYGRSISNNIIVNSASAPNGTSDGVFQGCSDGIYLDDNSTGVTVSGNTVANCVGGVFMHNNRNIILSGNTLFNNGVQLLIKHDNPTFALKNNTIQGNTIFSEYKNQPTLALRSLTNDIANFGVFSGNIYSDMIDHTFPILVNGKNISLSMWQGLYGKDLNSTVPTTPIPYYNVPRTNKRSMFANGTFPVNILGVHCYSVNGNFKIAWDNTNLDAGAVEGSFSFISGAANDSPVVTIDVGAISPSNLYELKFSMMGNKSNRRMNAYLRNTAAPYTVISETLYAPLDATRSENSFIFAPTAASVDATLVFAFEDEDIAVWLDNIALLSAQGALNNPNNNILFAYNATNAATNVNLTDPYLDVKNINHTGSVALAPFTSTILIKNPDSLSSSPPVIYDTPNASKELTAFTANQSAVGISVYPNPATDHLMLNFNDSGVKDLNIKLMNTNGDTILNQKVQVSDSSYQLNFGTKPSPGCYFIQVSGSGINQTTKVIII